MPKFLLMICGAPMALVVAGCGPSEIQTPGDAASARATLVQVLDAWKAGTNADRLREADPPVYATDSDWRAGKKLAAYEIAGEPVRNGGDWRVYALLTLASDGKPQRAQKACFTVAPGSPAVVLRSDVLD